MVEDGYVGHYGRHGCFAEGIDYCIYLEKLLFEICWSIYLAQYF